MLGTRGKGQWVCTEGNACTKGGVSPDGQLVVFERNSTFKSVMTLISSPFAANTHTPERTCRSMRRCLGVTCRDVRIRLDSRGRTNWKDINKSSNIGSLTSKESIPDILDRITMNLLSRNCR